MSESDLQKCAENLRQEVLSEAELEGEESLLRDAFTRVASAILVEAGEVEDCTVSYHHDHGVEVAGYNIGNDETLDLFVSIYSGSLSPARLSKGDIDGAFKRVLNFYRKALQGYHRSLEEASDGFDLSLQIQELRGDIQQLRLFVLTDSIAATYEREAEETDGVRVTFVVRDLTWLCRSVTAGIHQEAVQIDIADEFGGPVPCLAAPSVDGVYKAYLAILPAQLLSDLYDKYRDRLLELNVRSFLQARGKVNQGIRKTIHEEPAKFLAYNNGITATAERLDLCGLPDGGLGMIGIRHLQIVNGGQTTATIHYAARKDHAKLENIFVQAKIIVVPSDRLHQLVPLIARYSNTQNKVQEADFAANDRFHVRLEELSRTIWAPAGEGTNRQTRWFYERARGQYLQALAYAGTPSKQRAFKAENPLKQKFTKTDLAKHSNSWDQLPHVVSLGAQKNFKEFTLAIDRNKAVEPSESHFRRIVAQAILFKRTERLVTELALGGYRANVVTYTIALLSHLTARCLDLEHIWSEQDIDETTADLIRGMASQVHGVVAFPPGGRNVTEWCKRVACWAAVKELEIDLPRDFKAGLVDPATVNRGPAALGPELDAEARQALIDAQTVRAETWLRISRWAKETGTLLPWQRSLAYGLGRIARQGKVPSVKQAVQGMRLLREAQSLGFRDEDDED